MPETQILELTTRVIETKTDSRYLLAIQAQIAFAREIYVGTIDAASKNNGLAAEALLRTLFEVIASTIILAKQSERLEAFIRHGRFTELRMMRVIEGAALKARLAATVAATNEEYQRLWEEFKEERWHKMKTTASFVEAELPAKIYDQYYRRASTIAHGQPYVTVRESKVAARLSAWRRLATGASNMASLLMVFLLTVISREFKLGLEGETADLFGRVNSRLAKHMDAIREPLRR